jgi:putative MATE family efflux protein
MFIAGLIIMIVGPVAVRPLLRLIKTPDNVIDMCADYLIIISVGILGTAYFNGISGILRGLGDSLWPLAFLTFTCVLNICLDIWFVTGFGWGVAGVAWATVISQWLSSILCFWRLLRKNDVYEIRPKLLLPDKTLSLRLARLGLPAAATQIIFSLANIIVQALTNTFGSGVMASITIVMRIDSFAVMPMFSFGMAMSTFVGQNVGAKKLDRVAKGLKTGLIMILTVTVTILILIFIFGRMLMRVFTDTVDIIELSNTMLRILIPGYIGMSISQILFGVLRGAGDTVSSMWISIITTVVIRTPLAYLLAWMTRSPAYPVGRPEVIIISLMCAWITGAILAAIVYRTGRWRNKAVTRVAADAF